MNLTRLIAKIIALGWYEYEQEREALARPQKIEDNKKMLDLYERMIIESSEDIQKLKGGNGN